MDSMEVKVEALISPIVRNGCCGRRYYLKPIGQKQTNKKYERSCLRLKSESVKSKVE